MNNKLIYETVLSFMLIMFFKQIQILKLHNNKK